MKLNKNKKPQDLEKVESINKTKKFDISKFSYLGIRQMLMRFLTAWIITSELSMIISGKLFTDKDFFTSVSLVFFVLSLMFIWVFLCVVKNEKCISVLLISQATLYCVLAVLQEPDIDFAIGCCVIVAFIILFAETDGLSARLHKATIWIGLLLMIVAFTAVVGKICCMYYDDYYTPCYDFGLFSQMFYYMKETGLPLTTCERDGILSHFAVHASPVYYLVLPLYCIFPSPKTLLVVQCFIVAGGVIPLALICKKHGLRDIVTLIFSGCYLLYPCFAGGCFWYFHENNFLAPFILWFIYFAEKKKLVPEIIFALLLLSVKEDAAVYMAVIALYFIISRKNYKHDISMLALAIVYFLSVTAIIDRYGDGVMTYRYSNFMENANDSLFTVIISVIKNPVYAVQQCFTAEKMGFILKMLIPLGFLPLCSKKPERLILLIPFVLVNLMPDYELQYSVNYQYGFGSGAMLIYLAVINYADMGENRKKLLLTAMSCSILIFLSLFSSKIRYCQNYGNKAETRQAITEAMETIPDDATVAASEFFQPNLSQREFVYKAETTTHQCEYYILDLRLPENWERMKKYENDDYEIVYLEIDSAVVYKYVGK